MFPADKPIWFFKLMGPAAEMAKFDADFDRLLASVQVKDRATVPGFTLPEGWSRGGPRERGGIAIAETVILPGSRLEVTITQAGGDIMGNAVRWADQVGQTGDPAKFSRTFDAVGGKGLRVDVTGPLNPAKGPMMRGK
jgi:hypothetical protein